MTRNDKYKPLEFVRNRDVNNVNETAEKKILKKIVGIDGCPHCPHREHESRSGKSYCTHQATEGWDVTGWEEFPEWCPLPDDA